MSEHRKTWTFLALTLVGALVVVAVAVFAFGGRIAPLGAVALAPAAIGGPFALAGPDGRIVKDSEFRGEPMVVFFGYTHCPDVCPTTLYDLAQVKAALPAGAKVAVVFITVDPERDTPAIMQEYVGNFDPSFIGLSGGRPAIDAAMKAYRVYAAKVPGSTPEDYLMDHSAVVYLMDKNGQFGEALDISSPPADAAARIKAYL